MNRLHVIALSILVLTVAACDSSGGVRRTQSKVSVAPELDFGQPYLGDRIEASFPITANSEGAVRVLNVTTAHPQLVLDWKPTTLARGSTLDVKVVWNPGAPGAIDTTIEVEVDLEEAPRHTVHVKGEARALPTCDDGNQCTDDVFDRKTERCINTNHERACDDGNACTEEDQCGNGVCRGEGVTCDDDNVCTLNLCDPAKGCVFPPDGRQCDDNDPCTTDVCDPDDGCSYPDAPDGTTCGPFSCAVANICVLGTCRELDISGSSDGFPCSDGNACTEGDQCLAGRCKSGPPRANTGPDIVATLDTYGGEYAFAATDSFRYIFVDRQISYYAPLRHTNDALALRVTTFDGTTLQPRGGLPIRASSAPVMVDPGFFAIPNGNHVVLVDAVDPDHPAVVWESYPMPMEEFKIQQLVRMHHGLVVHGLWTPGPGQASKSMLMLLPFTTPTSAPGQWQNFLVNDLVVDIDASGDALAVSTGNGVLWIQIDAAGRQLQNVRVHPAPADKVTIEGQNIATLTTRRIEIWHMTNAWNRIAEFDGGRTSDLTLMNGNLFGVTPSGTWGDSIHGLMQGTFMQAVPMLDWQSGQTIERSEQDLLITGQLALPMRISGGISGALAVTRITGVGHGVASAATDGTSTRVIVGGKAAMGEVDLDTLSFSKWSLLPHQSGTNDSFLLKGTTRTVALQSQVWGNNGPLGACDGPDWSVFDGVAKAEQFQVCGLMAGTVAITPGHLWSAAVFERSTPGVPRQDKYGLRMWGLDPFSPTPLIEIPDTGIIESMAVRASFDQKYVGWLTHLVDTNAPNPIITRLQVIDARTGTASVIGEYPFEEGDANVVVYPESYALDGQSAITVIDGKMRLHPFQPVGPGEPTLLPEGTLASDTIPEAQRSYNRVEWMANGRAWVGWEKRPNLTDPVGQSLNRLSNVRYDKAANTIKHLGDIPLPGPLTSVYQQGDYAVATTNTAVVIVAPSCQ